MIRQNQKKKETRMNHWKRNRVIVIFLVLMFLISSGCSKKSVLKGSVNMISPIVPELVHACMRGVDTSYGQGEYALPGLIALVGGLSEVSPNNYTLAWTSSQIYLATSVYNELDRNDFAKELAWQGYRFGMRSLMTHKKFRKAVESGVPIEKAVKMLPKKYVEGLTWTAMSASLWMLMNITDIMSITYLPEANSMVKRACELNGDYFYGLPLMLDAVLSAMASQMVQGCGLDKALVSYKKMKEVTDGKLILGDTFWAQIYAVAIRDHKLYKNLLQGVLDAPDDILPYRGYYITTLAKGRAKYLLAHEKEIFENMGTIR